MCIAAAAAVPCTADQQRKAYMNNLPLYALVGTAQLHANPIELQNPWKTKPQNTNTVVWAKTLQQVLYGTILQNQGMNKGMRQQLITDFYDNMCFTDMQWSHFTFWKLHNFDRLPSGHLPTAPWHQPHPHQRLLLLLLHLARLPPAAVLLVVPAVTPTCLADGSCSGMAGTRGKPCCLACHRYAAWSHSCQPPAAGQQSSPAAQENCAHRTCPTLIKSCSRHVSMTAVQHRCTPSTAAETHQLVCRLR